MGNRPRTPQHFPRMKVRGQRRRHGQRYHQQLAALIAFGNTDWTSIAQLAAEAFTELTATFNRIAEALAEEAGLAEEGRRLASRREDLIAAGIDPSLLAIPLHPDTTALAEEGTPR